MVEIIKHASFDHEGGFYFYRVHLDKLDLLCKRKFKKMKDYLVKMFKECPHDYFHGGPRGSGLRYKLNCDLIEVKGHEISSLAELGSEEYFERYKTPHSRVQVYMLENDKNTIATEVPIWLMQEEMKFLKMKQPLTGHIDILRVENGNIWVWDYKPKAKHEKYAAAQVYFYALMLSKRTGISLDKFKCGYFDDEMAFMFKPTKNLFVKSRLSRFF